MRKTADSIITKRRRLWKHVQTTQQIHGMMCTLHRRHLGWLPRLLILPFLTYHLCIPGGPDSRLRAGVRIFPLASTLLEQLMLGGP